MMMNCGDNVLSRPSLGSWLTYGLGTVNQNLPGFMAMCPGGYPIVANSVDDAERQKANRLEQGFKVLAVMTRAR